MPRPAGGDRGHSGLDRYRRGRQVPSHPTRQGHRAGHDHDAASCSGPCCRVACPTAEQRYGRRKPYRCSASDGGLVPPPHPAHDSPRGPDTARSVPMRCRAGWTMVPPTGERTSADHRPVATPSVVRHERYDHPLGSGRVHPHTLSAGEPQSVGRTTGERVGRDADETASDNGRRPGKVPSELGLAPPDLGHLRPPTSTTERHLEIG